MPTQHTDIYNPTAPAINYAGPGKTWTIANGVLVGTGNPAAAAVYSSFNGSKLVNKGEVFGQASGGSYGVYFQAAKNGTVINKANGSIVGGFGVLVGNVPGAKNMTVMNDGSIIGLATYGVAAGDVSNFDLTNTGHIFGAVNRRFRVGGHGRRDRRADDRKFRRDQWWCGRRRLLSPCRAEDDHRQQVRRHDQRGHCLDRKPARETCWWRTTARSRATSLAASPPTRSSTTGRSRARCISAPATTPSRTPAATPAGFMAATATTR